MLRSAIAIAALSMTTLASAVEFEPEFVLAATDDPVEVRFDPERAALKVPAETIFTFKKEHVLLPNTSTTYIIKPDAQAPGAVTCWLSHESSASERIIRAGLVSTLTLVSESEGDYRRVQLKLKTTGGRALVLLCTSSESAEKLKIGGLSEAFLMNFSPQQVIN